MLFTDVLPGSFLFLQIEFDSIGALFVILSRKLTAQLCGITRKG